MPPERRLLLHVFPSFAVGGAQIRFCALANHFGARYRHVVVALDGDRAAAERLDPALDIVFPAIAIPKRRPFAALAACHAALARLAPDVLITCNWGAIEWALANRLRGIPHLHIEDGFGPEERTRQLPRRVWTRRLALARSTVALPSATLTTLARDVWRLAPARLRYIPNGIDLARFTAAPDPVPQHDAFGSVQASCANSSSGRAHRTYGDSPFGHRAPSAWTPEHGPLIGTIAALRPEKNIARLLHAFAAANARTPARLAIAGDGPEAPMLAALAGQLGIADRVRFLGHRRDPAPVHAAFDIFALSSDTEQMPLTLIEAMASRRPVAATDVGDVRAMLAEPNRAFVTPPDAEALAAALSRLIADAPLRAALGAANRARAEGEFDQARMFAAYGALFDGPG